MVAIHYAEEQAFLNHYIFTMKKAVDNVWIGAKEVGRGQFQWAADHSLMAAGGYTNWAVGSPKNHSDYCVQMSGDPDSVGRWADEPCARKNLVVCQQLPLPSVQLLASAVIELKHALADTKAELAQLKKDTARAIPLGFTYVQLPKDKAPSELWPSMTWTDISSSYEGVFFRVAGGEAASFGQVQGYNAPRLETIHVDFAGKNPMLTQHFSPYNLSLPMTSWSDAIHTGSSASGNYFFMNFKHTDVAEVRPKNMAIKVYKRTA